jgi:hypothetical protein
MQIRELLDLTESNALEPEKRVEKVFEWRHTRMLEVAKWALSASAALAVALVASILKDELKVGRIGQALLLALVVFFFVSGFLTLLRGSRLQREYTAALSLLARLTLMRALIQRYRQSGVPRRVLSQDKVLGAISQLRTAEAQRGVMAPVTSSLSETTDKPLTRIDKQATAEMGQDT